jgi:hypothetical protein
LKPIVSAGSSILIRGHRALFVGATALLGVAASEVATRTDAARYWLLLAGSALLMYVGDALSAVEARAQILSEASGVPIEKARYDKFRLMRPRRTLVLGVFGGALVAAGLVAPLPSSVRQSAVGSHGRLTCVAKQRNHGGLATYACTLMQQ